jgi:sugar phosphate permease
VENNTGWKKRHFILAILFITWMISYLDRMVMATAIPFIAKEWNLTPVVMGIVMSVFFGGYAVAQLAGGVLGDKYGPRKVSFFALVWWSVFTALTGAVNSLTAMIAVRIMFGIGEGLFPPCSFKSVSTWFPVKERGLAQAWMLAASSIGPAIAPLFVAAIMSAWGWRTVFFSLLIPGLFAAYLVGKYVLDNPADYKGISPQELAEINAEPPGAGIADSQPAVDLTFWQTLSMDAVWKTTFVLCAFNSALWGFGSWLPMYLIKAKGLSLAQMGLEAALPFIAGTFGLLLSGWLSDKVFFNNRKVPIIIGEVLAAACLFLMFTVNDSTLASMYRTFTGFFLFWSLGGIMPLPLAVVPRAAAARASGIILCGGFLGTLVAPTIMGYILEASGNNYNAAFAFVACCALISAAVATQIKQQRPDSSAAPSAKA